MRKHGLIREGLVAGAIGATVVALWFLLIDVLAGHPLYTPEVLGRSVLSILGPPFDDSTFVVILVYTIFHYVAFAVVGILAVAVVHAGEREPAVLAGAVVLFVVIELGFYGLSALLTEAPALGTLAWYQIGLANLVAAVAMGIYLWRAHPAISAKMGFALGGGSSHGDGQ